MKAYRFLDEADQELHEQIGYFLSRSLTAAEKFVGEVEAALLTRLGHRTSRYRVRGVLAIVVGGMLLELLFLKGFLSYWSASVWRILRALVTLT